MREVQRLENHDGDQQLKILTRLSSLAAEKDACPSVLKATAYCWLLGVGGNKDAAKAVELLKQAVDKGDSESAVRLGLLYEEGKVDKIDMDIPTALTWYQKGASLNDPLAQMHLARHAMPKDAKAAVGWLKRAADNGLAAAQTALANCLSIGKGGDVDLHEAMRLYTDAAAQGDPMA